MANLVIKGGTSQQVVDGSQDTLTILAVNNGTGLIHVGDPSPAGFDVPFHGGDQVILPANEPATLRADGFIVEATTGQYGGQTYEGGGGGGGLPSNQAIVENGTSVTLNPAPGNVVSLGRVYINVLGNAASFWLSDDRTAVTNGATAPVQNSAGAAIATGTFRIVGNAITYIRLPATVAGVSNGDIVTATGGQAIDIAVAAGVPSFTVRSFPFWQPFTMTAGDDGNGNIGYDAAQGYGSVTNQPVAGAVVDYINAQWGGDLIIRINMGDVAPNNITLTSSIGIGGVTYNPSTVQFYQEDGSGGQLEIYFAAVSFAWTDGQQVPIVIIP